MSIFDELGKHKVIIIFGMFGCGKTELAINMALELSKKHKVALADIDTISPYYRSRDEKSRIESQGVTVITPPERLMHADLPMIVPQVGGFIQNNEYKVILDVGGNEDGATVLGSLNNFINPQDYLGLFVINERRPFSATVEEVSKNIQALSVLGRIKIHYIVNNTNLSSETTPDIIRNGELLAEELALNTGIPILCTVVPDSMTGNDEITTVFSKLILKRHLKNIWE